ncbi:outer spore coat protein CotE [Mycoplasmatota bacterium]|nr:outer spore coat protein CotE [Mycoplasmatota bacterium]
MNEIREIVTKAIVEKGKKAIRFVEKVKTTNPVESVLGCWVLNHNFQAEKTTEGVLIQGIFEVNIWYSYNNNSQTEVTKEMVNYQQEVKTKRKINDYLEKNTDVIVRMIQPPVCSDVKIVDNIIEIEVLLEVAAEVIGETKMRVSVLDQIPNYDNDDDDDMNEIDGQINQQFLREKIF